VAQITGNACCNAASCGIISPLIQVGSTRDSSPDKTENISKQNIRLIVAGDSAAVNGIAPAW
jgi:hypothetical protein